MIDKEMFLKFRNDSYHFFFFFLLLPHFLQSETNTRHIVPQA